MPSSVTASLEMAVPANVGSGTDRTMALICFTDDIIVVSVSFSRGHKAPVFDLTLYLLVSVKYQGVSSAHREFLARRGLNLLISRRDLFRTNFASNPPNHTVFP